MVFEEHWQGPQMILVRMGQDGGVDVLALEGLEQGLGVETLLFWMGPTVKDEIVAVDLQQVGVGPNFEVFSKIGETKNGHDRI